MRRGAGLTRLLGRLFKQLKCACSRGQILGAALFQQVWDNRWDSGECSKGYAWPGCCRPEGELIGFQAMVASR